MSCSNTQKTSDTNPEVRGAFLQCRKNPAAKDMQSADITFIRLMSDALCCGTDEILQEKLFIQKISCTDSEVRSALLWCRNYPAILHKHSKDI